MLTWAPLLERLASVWNDVPTHVAVVGLALYSAAGAVLMRFASCHYIKSAATGWRWKTWEKASGPEQAAGRRRWRSYGDELQAAADLPATQSSDGGHTSPG